MSLKDGASSAPSAYLHEGTDILQNPSRRTPFLSQRGSLSLVREFHAPICQVSDLAGRRATRQWGEAAAAADAFSNSTCSSARPGREGEICLASSSFCFASSN